MENISRESMVNTDDKRRGFTLLEVLLSVAAISILAGMSLPVYQYVQSKNDLDLAALTIVHSIRRAQILSQAVDGDISWGVYIQQGSITVFKGLSFAARDTNLDEVFEISSSITPSGNQEIVFTRLLGEPQSLGTTTLTNATNETRTITINARGMVSY